MISQIANRNFVLGQEAERERILALLEAEDWDAPEIAAPYVRHIIALIKGDTK